MSCKHKYDWFQTDSHVTLTIMKKAVELEKCKVKYSAGFLVVTVSDEEIFAASLFNPIDETNFTVKCTPSKVEVTMKKTTPGRWQKLSQEISAKGDGPSTDQIKFASRNWDQIEKDAEKEEEAEQLEGEAAVNKMFQKIYKDANDDVKKAMIKSYSESGGTVLSTNWADIKKKKVDVKPPESMEYKKFEQ